MKPLFLAAAILLMPALAHAQGQALHARTAGDLAELCSANGKDPAGAARLNFCLGYAQATFDLEIKHAGDKKPFCLPTPAPTRQATMAEFANWVKGLPENKALNSQVALMRYMAQRFPCKA